MGAGTVVSVIGAAGTGVTALVAALMEGRSQDLESGEFVRENLASMGVPDVYATHICDSGNFVRGWGMRETRDGRQLLHPGIDIAGEQGTVIRAWRSAVVEHSGQKNGYGESLLLRHSDGSTSLYAHLNDRLVERGAIVQGGSPIAMMGRTSGTGRKPRAAAAQGGPRDPRCRRFAQMGPHLHFSLHGLAGRPKLPASVRFTVSTPYEGRFGTDPVQVLGARGVRYSATSRA